MWFEKVDKKSIAEKKYYLLQLSDKGNKNEIF
jgi:hypothetical protein